LTYFESPYLVGFEYSRNASPTEISEKMPSSPEEAIYLHPETINDNRPPFRKKFDLYTLGLLLLEIGTWKPLKLMLDFEAVREAQESGNVEPVITYLCTGKIMPFQT